MTIRAEDLEVQEFGAAAFMAWQDMVNIEESVFGGIEAAFLAGPADITEGEMKDTVELVKSVESSVAEFLIISGQAKGMDFDGADVTGA